MLFQRAAKGVCSRRLRYVWRGPNGFIMSFIFCTGSVHRVHSSFTTYVLLKGGIVYILPGVLNFQHVRNLLGVQLRSSQYAYYFI